MQYFGASMFSLTKYNYMYDTGFHREVGNYNHTDSHKARSLSIK